MIANMTRSQVDEETEFARIPIAGENDSDYDTDSTEIEEEEVSSLPHGDTHEALNAHSRR